MIVPQVVHLDKGGFGFEPLKQKQVKDGERRSAMAHCADTIGIDVPRTIRQNVKGRVARKSGLRIPVPEVCRGF